MSANKRVSEECAHHVYSSLGNAVFKSLCSCQLKVDDERKSVSTECLLLLVVNFVVSLGL